MKPLEEMLNDLRSLNERFLTPDKSNNLNKIDQKIKDTDKGIDSINKKQDDGKSSGPKEGDDAVQPEGEASGSAEKVAAEALAEQVVPMLSKSVSDGASNLAMLVRAIPMIGMPQNKIAEKFGPDFVQKVEEMAKGLESLASYFQPKSEWMKQGESVSPAAFGKKAEEVPPENVGGYQDPAKLVGVHAPSNTVEAPVPTSELINAASDLLAKDLADGRIKGENDLEQFLKANGVEGPGMKEKVLVHAMLKISGKAGHA